MCHKLDHEACWTKVENDTTPLTHSPGQKKKKKTRESLLCLWAIQMNVEGKSIFQTNKSYTTNIDHLLTDLCSEQY